jgi:hypothetical protein
MNQTKDISYLGKDFSNFKKNLIDFTKQYFPNSYTDFNESSPGMVLIELASYVGDVLSYYSDSNLKESLLEHASERANVLDLARALGYNAKNITGAQTNLDLYIIVPAIGTGDNVRPDYNYAVTVQPGLRVKQQDGVAEFRTLDYVDFTTSSSFDPTEVTVYEADTTTNLPIYYLLKKTARATSGTVKTATFSFDGPVPYDKIVLPDLNVIDILSIEESDGDNWYQVPYLAQDTVFEDVPNLVENDPDLSQYRSSVTNLLKLKKTSKRYVTRLRSDNKTEIQFGAGISDNNDEEIIPNPDNVGNGLAGFRRPIDVDIDPSNFLYTRAYGQAPANTTLTVTYTIGNGVADNVDANTLTEISQVKFLDNINSSESTGMLNFVKRSLTVNNPNPAAGARSQETLNEIKNSALGNFATQNRLVTAQDYIVRSYSMPTRFGSVAKAYIVPDDQISQQQQIEARVQNPLAMNMYVLGYNVSKQLTVLNPAVKENLKSYLDYYRILTDAINIKDAYIINIGVEFEITVQSNYNSNDVLLRTINNVKEFFNIDRWQINQPIVKSEVVNVIANTEGVQNVVGVIMNNKIDSDLGYSGNAYDLSSATKNGIIYPSLDPSIFEVKFPDSDIKGRVVNY